MKWIEVSVTTSQEAADTIAEILMEKGANGTEMVDPKAFREVLEKNSYLDYADDGFIESYGADVIIKAYYSEDRNPAEMTDELRLSLKEMEAHMDTGPAIVSWQLRDDTEWKDAWKEYYKPFRFTDRIVIKPSWEEYSPEKNDIVIELDPGMAFGTGTHETTRMCAMLGEKHIRQGDKVLDLGCGTAILAVAAAKMGAGKALAVDIDDAAVKVAIENIEKNKVDKIIDVRRGILTDIPAEPFDLVFVNIIADVIISLAPQIRHYLKRDSRLILSGIIRDRRDEVFQAYGLQGFTEIEELNMGEWVAMVLHA